MLPLQNFFSHSRPSTSTQSFGKKSCLNQFFCSRHMFLGHDMGISDFDGRTPLHLASAEGHLECVRFLLQSCGVPAQPADRYFMPFKVSSITDDAVTRLLSQPLENFNDKTVRSSQYFRHATCTLEHTVPC